MLYSIILFTRVTVLKFTFVILWFTWSTKLRRRVQSPLLRKIKLTDTKIIES